MTPYEQVCNLLWTGYGWSKLNSPAPNATNAQLAVDTYRTVAEKLHSHLLSVVAAGLPYGCKPEDGYAWACHAWFETNRKFWEHDTSIALGQQHELPVDTIGKAESPTQWWDHQERLRNRLGEKLCDQVEFDRRKSYANLVPLEWTSWPGGGLIYQLAVREEYMPVGATKFDPMYLQTFPKLDDVRGLDALQWMQNMAAKDMGKPGGEWPWLVGGAKNPEAK